MGFRRLETRIEGLVLVEPDVFPDSRGFFLETFRARRVRELGIDVEFVQDNHSRSQRGAIRAFHFQLEPGQAKLVRAARGRGLRRRDRPAPRLPHLRPARGVRAERREPPPAVRAGRLRARLLRLSDVADVTYKVSSYYDPATERGIAFDDPDLGVEWPVDEPLVSDRDRTNPRLSRDRGRASLVGSAGV